MQKDNTQQMDIGEVIFNTIVNSFTSIKAKSEHHKKVLTDLAVYGKYEDDKEIIQ